MTTMANEITIHAPARRVFDLASDTARWPKLLPHYRFVRVLAQNGSEQTIEMAARRGWIPVRWKAIQRNDSQTPLITFHHIAGWTRGMDVRWEFAERNGTTKVRIVHDLDFRFPIFAHWIERHIVGNFFIHAVAQKTLRCMKVHAEAADG